MRDLFLSSFAVKMSTLIYLNNSFCLTVLKTLKANNVGAELTQGQKWGGAKNRCRYGVELKQGQKLGYTEAKRAGASRVADMFLDKNCIIKIQNVFTTT